MSDQAQIKVLISVSFFFQYLYSCRLAKSILNYNLKIIIFPDMGLEQEIRVLLTLILVADHFQPTIRKILNLKNLFSGPFLVLFGENWRVIKRFEHGFFT